MQDVTILPSFSNPYTLHFGSEAHYERFSSSSYFIKEYDEPQEKYIYKHIILQVKYQPDKLYQMNDGMFGKCWLVTINDNENEKIHIYYIRNWIEIVHYYKEKGLVFVDESKK